MLWKKLNYDGPTTPIFYYVDFGHFTADVCPVGEGSAKPGAQWTARINTESKTLSSGGPFETLDEAKRVALNLAKKELQNLANTISAAVKEIDRRAVSAWMIKNESEDGFYLDSLCLLDPDDKPESDDEWVRVPWLDGVLTGEG